MELVEEPEGLLYGADNLVQILLRVVGVVPRGGGGGAAGGRCSGGGSIDALPVPGRVHGGFHSPPRSHPPPSSPSSEPRLISHQSALFRIINNYFIKIPPSSYWAGPIKPIHFFIHWI